MENPEIQQKKCFCYGRKKKKNAAVLGVRGGNIRICCRRVNPLPGMCCCVYKLPVTLCFFLGIISIIFI